MDKVASLNLRADLDSMAQTGRTLTVGPKQWEHIKEANGWFFKSVSPSEVCILGCRVFIDSALDGVTLTAEPPPVPRPKRTYA